MPEDTKTTTVDTGEQDVLNVLTDRLVNNEAVTSNDTGIDQVVNRAISGLENARDLTGQRIESTFGRERNFLVGQLNANRTAALEQRVGGATQMTALKLMEESNIKYVNDLESRKQEALLANDAQTAKQIADIQLNALAQTQQAKQNVFNNLLGVANLAQRNLEQGRLSAQFKQNLQLQRDQMAEANRRTIADLAATYGVSIDENETLESITEKIAPIVGEQRAAEIAALNRQNQRVQEEVETRFDVTGEMYAALEADPTMTSTDLVAVAALYYESIGQKIPSDELAKLQADAIMVQKMYAADVAKANAAVTTADAAVNSARKNFPASSLFTGGVPDAGESDYMLDPETGRIVPKRQDIFGGNLTIPEGAQVGRSDASKLNVSDPLGDAFGQLFGF